MLKLHEYIYTNKLDFLTTSCIIGIALSLPIMLMFFLLDIQQLHPSLDQSLFQSLNSTVKLSRFLVIIITAVFALAIFLLTSNSIKLIGMINSFTRKECLYLGCWYGIAGSIIAWAILSKSFGINLKATLLLFVFGIFFGTSGAWAAVGKYLSKIEIK